MGVIEDKRKFKIKKKQTFPTNPTGTPKLDNKEFDINRKTIKESQTKE
tara:strand:+ start:1816 stop:1959 length:144 start_codon:yes stop_codon:yes gene_type:complete